MNHGIIDIENYFVQRSITRFPEEVKIVLSEIYDDFRTGVILGKAPTDDRNIYTDRINIIPSKHRGSCCPILIGKCYDKDHFENRMLECLNHASITCVGINNEIFFFTSQWNSYVVNRYRGYIDSLKLNGVSINMIYVTPLGIALMPV